MTLPLSEDTWTDSTNLPSLSKKLSVAPAVGMNPSALMSYWMYGTSLMHSGASAVISIEDSGSLVIVQVTSAPPATVTLEPVLPLVHTKPGATAEYPGTLDSASWYVPGGTASLADPWPDTWVT